MSDSLCSKLLMDRCSLSVRKENKQTALRSWIDDGGDSCTQWEGGAGYGGVGPSVFWGGEKRLERRSRLQGTNLLISINISISMMGKSRSASTSRETWRGTRGTWRSRGMCTHFAARLTGELATMVTVIMWFILMKGQHVRLTMMMIILWWCCGRTIAWLVFTMNWRCANSSEPKKRDMWLKIWFSALEAVEGEVTFP